MQRIVDRAIVLGRVNYGEADRIVTVLSEKSGKLTLLAKGVRKQKSKLAGGLEVFNINEITYIPGKKEIATLVSSKQLEGHNNIVKDFDTSQDVFTALKWLHDHLEQGTGDEFFDLLAGFLYLADHAGALASIWFYMRAFELSGHGLNPFHDEHGKKLEAAESYIFDYDNSVFSPGDKGEFTQDDIKLLRLAAGLKPDDFARISITQNQALRLRQLINRQLQLNF